MQRGVRHRTVACLAIAVGLFAAACGGDGKADESTTSTTDPGGSRTTVASTTQPPTTEPDAPSAPQLAGTRWRVTDYSLAPGSLTNVWPDTEISLEFSAEGALTGSSGCNDYGATYEVIGPYDEFEEGVRDGNDGQTIRIGRVEGTEKGCTPPRIMEQETEYLELLSAADRWLLARGNLILRTADGLIIEAEPAR